jgi:hypothetical protein
MRSTTDETNGLRDDNGVVAIELVLLLPLIFALLFGMIQFGRAYNAKVELTSAVREGARALTLGTGDPEQTTKDAAPGLDPDAITVTTSTDPCTFGDQAWVIAKYDFELTIPFWGDETVEIDAKGVMRCGG